MVDFPDYIEASEPAERVGAALTFLRTNVGINDERFRSEALAEMLGITIVDVYEIEEGYAPVLPDLCAGIIEAFPELSEEGREQLRGWSRDSEVLEGMVEELSREETEDTVLETSFTGAENTEERVSSAVLRDLLNQLIEQESNALSQYQERGLAALQALTTRLVEHNSPATVTTNEAGRAALQALTTRLVEHNSPATVTINEAGRAALQALTTRLVEHDSPVTTIINEVGKVALQDLIAKAHAAGLPNAQLSEEIGVSLRTVNNWARGEGISARNADNLERVLQAHDMIEGEAVEQIAAVRTMAENRVVPQLARELGVADATFYGWILGNSGITSFHASGINDALEARGLIDDQAREQVRAVQEMIETHSVTQQLSRELGVGPITFYGWTSGSRGITSSHARSVNNALEARGLIDDQTREQVEAVYAMAHESETNLRNRLAREVGVASSTFNAWISGRRISISHMRDFAQMLHRHGVIDEAMERMILDSVPVIRELMGRYDASIQELSAGAGLNTNTIYNWVAGRSRPALNSHLEGFIGVFREKGISPHDEAVIRELLPPVKIIAQDSPEYALRDFMDRTQVSYRGLSAALDISMRRISADVRDNTRTIHGQRLDLWASTLLLAGALKEGTGHISYKEAEAWKEAVVEVRAERRARLSGDKWTQRGVTTAYLPGYGPAAGLVAEASVAPTSPVSSDARNYQRSSARPFNMLFTQLVDYLGGDEAVYERTGLREYLSRRPADSIDESDTFMARLKDGRAAADERLTNFLGYFTEDYARIYHWRISADIARERVAPENIIGFTDEEWPLVIRNGLELIAERNDGTPAFFDRLKFLRMCEGVTGRADRSAEFTRGAIYRWEAGEFVPDNIIDIYQTAIGFDNNIRLILEEGFSEAKRFAAQTISYPEIIKIMQGEQEPAQFLSDKDDLGAVLTPDGLARLGDGEAKPSKEFGYYNTYHAVMAGVKHQAYRAALGQILDADMEVADSMDRSKFMEVREAKLENILGTGGQGVPHALRYARLAEGRTAADLAREIGIQPDHLTRLEREILTIPSARIIQGIKQAVSLSPKEDAMLRHGVIVLYLSKNEERSRPGKDINQLPLMLGHNPKNRIVPDLSSDTPVEQRTIGQQDNARLLQLIEDGVINGYECETVPNPWPDVLRAIRQAPRMSQRSAADAYNRYLEILTDDNIHRISRDVWRGWESGNSRPDPSQQETLYAVFGSQFQIRPGMTSALMERADSEAMAALADTPTITLVQRSSDIIQACRRVAHIGEDTTDAQVLAALIPHYERSDSAGRDDILAIISNGIGSIHGRDRIPAREEIIATLGISDVESAYVHRNVGQEAGSPTPPAPPGTGSSKLPEPSRPRENADDAAIDRSEEMVAGSPAPPAPPVPADSEASEPAPPVVITYTTLVPNYQADPTDPERYRREVIRARVAEVYRRESHDDSGSDEQIIRALRRGYRDRERAGDIEGARTIINVLADMVVRTFPEDRGERRLEPNDILNALVNRPQETLAPLHDHRLNANVDDLDAPQSFRESLRQWKEYAAQGGDITFPEYCRQEPPSIGQPPPAGRRDRER